MMLRWRTKNNVGYFNYSDQLLSNIMPLVFVVRSCMCYDVPEFLRVCDGDASAVSTKATVCEFQQGNRREETSCNRSTGNQVPDKNFSLGDRKFFVCYNHIIVCYSLRMGQPKMY